MALLRNRPSEIPKDAIILNEEEALTYQWKIITGWDKFSDVWALRYSSGILGGFSALSGIWINRHYRNKLRLGNYGKLSTYLPIVVIPAMFSILTHRFFVQRSTVLNSIDTQSRSTVCPICFQVRAAAWQSGFGVVYPTVLAPLAAFMFATRHYTYRLPSITSEPLEVFKFYRKITKPILPTLGMMLIAHSFLAMFITYKETEQLFNLQNQLYKLDKDSEEEMVH